MVERVLVLGSGALQIAQAGEFDYSGSQALKALRESGIRTILINPNIATIQTSAELADEVYLLPVTPDTVEDVIARERIDSILLAFGGQTALNCGLELASRGVLDRHHVRVLGTSVASIRAAEDRKLFAEKLGEIAVSVARSRAATTVDEAIAAAKAIGLPVILRAGFSLGGRGSAIVRTETELASAITRAFSGNAQVLVEECLAGWQEIEYEVLRDAADNAITICNMENVDPMGIHTGESIVVAPSQTLSDADYQQLRDISLRIARHFEIVGECNVQFARNPLTGDYRVIEINPRLSRSSALASKATGYPIAYIAAKVALGRTLPELQNPVTGTTSAFFEPALDYIVCKMPRWDFEKFAGAEPFIGTEMKSVGEVMSIGRSFGEALQKAIRMLEIGATGLDASLFDSASVHDELQRPSARRVFAIARAFADGASVEDVFRSTSIDRFFLAEMQRLTQLQHELATRPLDRELLSTVKRNGFSDAAIARAVGSTESEIRARRHELGIRPRLAQIDTLAAEYPAKTNYLYMTYGAEVDDAPATRSPKALVLGSGPYRIGSSVEFDWCCVQAAAAIRELGIETIVVNCNPETVSTDFDACDRLIFDELTLETVLEIAAHEEPLGIVVSMGGQTPNNLALKLERAGARILGTAASSIDRAEDRNKFSSLCDSLGIDQPRWAIAKDEHDLESIIDQVGGFPILVRPSYVLSGAAMRVANSKPELSDYLARATHVSPEHPVVISKFEKHARELEYDAVADRGEIKTWAIAEHIEEAGVHSGDATLVLPPQQLTVETVNRARKIGARLARALEVTGPFNVQLLARDNEVKVIECNLRASRSFPFVSKVLATNLVREAIHAMLRAHVNGAPRTPRGHNPLELDYVAVKAPQFSFRRLTGADPLVGVEMLSTGEVACFGDDLAEALLKALHATGFRAPKKGVLLSLGPVGDKYQFTDEARLLDRLGLRLYATPGTADMLREEGVACTAVAKHEVGTTPPEAVQLMRRGDIDLVINIPRDYDQKGRPDGYLIRRAAIDLEIPLLTDLTLARQVVRALARVKPDELRKLPLSAYLRRGSERGGT